MSNDHYYWQHGTYLINPHFGSSGPIPTSFSFRGRRGASAPQIMLCNLSHITVIQRIPKAVALVGGTDGLHFCSWANQEHTLNMEVMKAKSMVWDEYLSNIQAHTLIQHLTAWGFRPYDHERYKQYVRALGVLV